jgi:hypothetical protein
MFCTGKQSYTVKSHWLRGRELFKYEPVSVIIIIGMEKMSKVSIKEAAPDFALENFHGQEVRLSGFRGKQPVVLVFNGALDDRFAKSIWRSCAMIITGSQSERRL